MLRSLAWAECKNLTPPMGAPFSTMTSGGAAAVLAGAAFCAVAGAEAAGALRDIGFFADCALAVFFAGGAEEGADVWHRDHIAGSRSKQQRSTERRQRRMSPPKGEAAPCTLPAGRRGAEEKRE